jgi:2',3'-cyclic-nucleotide 2'-phosphodiesterase (5'-nucleotidase family)
MYFLKNYACWLMLVLAAGCKTSYQPSSKNVRLTPMDSAVAPKPEVEDFIAPYKKQLDEKMNRVIGKAPKDITKAGDKESALGNLVADLQAVKAAEYSGKKIDLSLVTSGGLRVPMLASGDITVGDIYELMPFDNEVWVLTLKGETLQKMFVYMGNRNGVSLANVQVTFRGKDPETILIGGKPLEMSNLYNLAISDYLASGGDGMSFLAEVVETKKMDHKLRDAIISYVEDQTKQGKNIEANIEGRVFVK